ncbi:SulP family inorganic anion transporter [Vagococcus sp. PNs007]|uniref:SulP family inorganic anion transporter n=1 Tax=Vagococcus proximus TaxID=2991417 RepID=A0ABT5WZF7_9ENTE|nr:SulP family inorganic anion transporter [Vagococcus proximus]MDF0478991.1 SulP family inorganic anion transporter [Vagococcus proximus]
MLLSIKKEEWLGQVKNDFFAGLVSSIAILPEVIGFAIIAGVNPLTALFGSSIMMLVISFMGGRPAMVTAAAGSMAMVMVGLIKAHGIEYMLAATVLTGIFQLLLGYAGIHKLMRYISKTVMYGFVNALAIMIFMAQVQQLPGQSVLTFVMVGITILLMYVLPKVTTLVPPALIAIVMMGIVSYVMPGQFQVIGDLGDLSQTSFSLALPNVPFTLETLSIIIGPAIALTMVGLIETLLTLPIVDEMTETTGDSKREVKAQGLANLVTAFFGGPAGCAMIGQAVINVKSGGRTRLSTLVGGLSLLILILVGKDVMLQIPTAVLIGIMITVAIATFNWESLSLIRTFQVTESFIMIMTVAVVVYTHNLAIGIALGVLLSALVFMAKLSSIKITENEETISVSGPLYFASVQSFNRYFSEKESTLKGKQIDFSHMTVLDHSAEEALVEWLRDYHTPDNQLQLIGLPQAK